MAAEFSTTVYNELHALAARQLEDQRANHTLQPTALVHEAFLRIAKLASAGAEGRRQYFALAGKAMRSVLVDHARRRNALKRGGRPLTLDTGLAGPDGLAALDVLVLHEALERLGELDPELVEIVELVFFSGLTEVEAANVLGVSDRTVRRGWRTAKAWLRQALGDAAEGPPLEA